MESQWQHALACANRVRRMRAELKVELRRGDRSIEVLLDDLPGWLDTMPVLELLLSLWGVGPVKAHKWLTELRVSPFKTIGSLSLWQRRELSRRASPSHRKRR